MVSALNINAPQSAVVAVYNLPSHDARLTQADGVAVLAGPTLNVRASETAVSVAFRRIADIHASQTLFMAVVRGRVANPRLRSWTFTLDGHDFYVLRLGDRATLIYDTASEQWIEWDEQNLPFWAVTTGISWIGGQQLAYQYGSNIVVGDDTQGVLWFLDPDSPYDEAADATRVTQQLAFGRVVTGQVLARGRQNLPCYALFVDGDNYGLMATDFVPSVTLETSDDQGRTFFTHDTLTVTPNFSDDSPYSWYSLGQISSPGRIFRVTDNGLFTRIDGMEMNDDG